MKTLTTLLISLFAIPTVANSETMVRYLQPAEKWMEAIPMGNGRLSGMVYGGIAKERIALNEISLWSGQPDETSNDLCGEEALAEMREAFFNDNPEKGNELGQKYLNGRMTSFGTHLPLGDLVLEFQNSSDNIKSYSRTLDMEKGETNVTYLAGENEYTRKYLSSFPDQVIAINLTAEQKGSLNLSVSFDLLRDAVFSVTGNELSFSGKVDFPLHGPGGVNFFGMVKVLTDDGVVNAIGDKLTISDATNATLLFDTRTDYTGSQYKETCINNLRTAAEKSWADLESAHLADYTGLFGRMSINLGESANTTLPTDVRLKLVKSGAVDAGLDALFFQYGRYMLISSSRPNGTPLCANLQGIWNDNGACNMPWTCDYHLDININQNYWSANRANLAECNEPLFNYLEFLAHHGAETARKMYGCNGWVAHTVCNAWGYTAPGWGVSWGMNVTGGAWLATQLWSHYLYTEDKEYLKNTGYPLLKKTAEFFCDYMVEDPRNGYLVTGPSISPENGYVSSSGNHLSLSMMPTIDREIVHEIYSACVQASEILGVDKKFRNRLKKDLKRFPPISIGPGGQVNEWDGEQQRSDPSHRHSSHLLGLFPLNQISVATTPDLAAAARRSLETQTSDPNWEDTEWSTANMLCMYARLKDGEMAHYWLQNLFNRFTRENLMTVSPAGVAMAESDIFSFDATEASVAGMCEMLLQSQDGYLEFLPALPAAWKDGEVKGLCAEGGLTVDMKWRDGKMSEASVRSSKDRKLSVKGFETAFNLKKNTPLTVKFD